MTSASAPRWWWHSSRRSRCRIFRRSCSPRSSCRSICRRWRGDRWRSPNSLFSGRDRRVVQDGAMSGPTWGFLTNHFYVLRCIAQEPSLTLREVAERIGITERAVQRIVSELEEGGYLLRQRDGRRNRYVLREGRPRRELDATLPLRELLGFPEEGSAEQEPGTPRVLRV